MNSQRYLERIGLGDAELAADPETLSLLQRSHLLSVPFENLDIHWKRPIFLDIDRFFEKIVVKRRGGFCYELNGLFNELLTSIGFRTRLVSARVFHDDGTTGPEYDHAAIIVTIGENEFLADVGFGDFTDEPLRFVLDKEQHDRNDVFIVRRFDGDYLEIAKRDGDGWRGQYVFTDTPRELSEFTEMCEFQQYSPESHFTKGKLCSIMTETGRKTLTDKKFIITNGDRKEELEIESEDRFNVLLNDEFDIQRLQ